jgi:hypothetical protein
MDRESTSGMKLSPKAVQRMSFSSLEGKKNSTTAARIGVNRMSVRR